MFLLDVNILIALADPKHVHRARALKFFAEARSSGWATCPLTENGFLRILGHPSYANGPGSPEVARSILRSFCMSPGHQHWQDSISFVDQSIFPTLPPSKALTDHYLVGLAAHHKARFATMDHRIDASLIPGGAAAYFIVP